MATDLVRGAYSGRETKLFYNTATHASAAWSEIVRARNIQFTDGPGLSEIEFHGAGSIGNIPGYDKFSGSFEYVRRKGTDTVFAALLTARRNRSIVELQYLNGPIDVDGSAGWMAPVLLGEFQETANGGDGVVVTIPFAKADAFDAVGDSVEVTDVTITI